MRAHGLTGRRCALSAASRADELMGEHGLGEADVAMRHAAMRIHAAKEPLAVAAPREASSALSTPALATRMKMRSLALEISISSSYEDPYLGVEVSTIL